MRQNKKRKAAKLREEAKRLARETAMALALSMKSEPNVPDPVPLDYVTSEQSNEINIKQESPEQNSFLEEHSEDIKVEVLEPAVTEPDPIAEITEPAKPVVAQKRKRFRATMEDLYEARCQFCLKRFLDIGEPVSRIARNRVVFVLDFRNWGSPQKNPNCCKTCRKMFDLFNTFKRSCLVALTQPEFLLTSGVKNDSLDEYVSDPEEEKQPCNYPEVEVRFSPMDLQRETISPNVANEDSTEKEQSTVTEMAAQASEKVDSKTGKKQRKYCFRCKKFYATEAIYDEHKPTCTKPPRDPPPLACPKCPSRFNRQDQLMYHMNRHNGLRTVPCRREGCQKMFFDPYRRTAHEALCGKEVQIICNVCGSIFRSISALRAHMALHGDPTFVCEVCNKAFHTKAKLKKHSGVHSEARNHECKVCGKRFKSHEANRVHQRIHTQEKPYVCHICGMAFTYNCLLKTHLEKGHEEAELMATKD